MATEAPFPERNINDRYQAGPGPLGARWAGCAGDLGKEQTTGILRSHQLSVGSHPTPTDLLSAKEGKANRVGLCNDKTKAKSVTLDRQRAGLRGRALSSGNDCDTLKEMDWAKQSGI